MSTKHSTSLQLRSTYQHDQSNRIHGPQLQSQPSVTVIQGNTRRRLTLPAILSC